jgi:hypothetical protein
LNSTELSIQFEEYDEPIAPKWSEPAVCGCWLWTAGHDADDPDQQQDEYNQGCCAADMVEPIPAGICSFDISHVIHHFLP